MDRTDPATCGHLTNDISSNAQQKAFHGHLVRGRSELLSVGHWAEGGTPNGTNRSATRVPRPVPFQGLLLIFGSRTYYPPPTRIIAVVYRYQPFQRLIRLFRPSGKVQIWQQTSSRSQIGETGRNSYWSLKSKHGFSLDPSILAPLYVCIGADSKSPRVFSSFYLLPKLLNLAPPLLPPQGTPPWVLLTLLQSAQCQLVFLLHIRPLLQYDFQWRTAHSSFLLHSVPMGCHHGERRDFIERGG